MKKNRSLLSVVVLIIMFGLMGCSALGLGGEKKESVTVKRTELDDIITDRDVVKELIQAYKLKEQDGVYTGSNPAINLEVDGDGLLTKLEILSDGLTFHGVEVGDVFNIDNLDKKMSDFKPAEEYALEKGAVYFSTNTREKWYVYFQSKKSDAIERITVGLALDSELEKLADKVGLAETQVSSEAEPMTSQAMSTEAMPMQTTQAAVMQTETAMQETVPVTVIQVVPAPTAPPQTVYVQVPVYQNNNQDATYLIPDSDVRSLSDSEVNGMTTEYARYALNEIYARHGRMFKDEALQAYFDSQAWYTGSVAPDQFKESWLNPVEKANVQKLDKRRNGKTLP